MKNVLVIGAGLVSRPLVRYLLDEPDIQVTVAEQDRAKADAVVSGHKNGTTVALEVADAAKLTSLIRAHDLTVSLLPAPLHPIIARLCIQERRSMVTASYVSPEMRAMDEGAKDAGVILLNEIGVDPGLDHMSAMRVIHEVQARGGTIVSFKSCCGGLPAPDCNDNPWGYKFSWSPRGVCTSGKRPAQYRVNGRAIKTAGTDLFTDNQHGMTIDGVGTLEAYPNGDSLGYIDLYGLDGIETMLRGTLRYPGWCETLKAVVDLGWLEEIATTYPTGTTYAQFVARSLGEKPTREVRQAVAAKLGLPADSPILDRFAWLGLFSDETITPATEETTPLDVLCARMAEKMPYRDGERDMIVLRHDFIARFPDDKHEHIASTLIDYGQPGGDSAMSRTVGLPAAVAAKLIVTGKINLTGVQIPVTPDLYNLILDELDRLGIRCTERTEAVN